MSEERVEMGTLDEATFAGNTSPDNASTENGCCAIVLIFISVIFMIICPFSLLWAINVVTEYERVVIFRLGRIQGAEPKGPGIFFVIPCVDTMRKMDLRTKSFDVASQEILTKDSLTVRVDAVVFYKVSNPTLAVCAVDNADSATQLLAQTTLRNCLGTRNLQEILQQRDNLAVEIRELIDPPTNDWGIKVERVEIKDVSLPMDMQRSMAAEAEATREARAKVVAAEGERNAARALKEAADVIAESPSALQLRYLQTLNTISAEKNSTILFPLPIELMQAFISKKN